MLFQSQAKDRKHLSANIYDMLTLKNRQMKVCDKQVDIIIGKGGRCVFWCSGWGQVGLINKE